MPSRPHNTFVCIDNVITTLTEVDVAALGIRPKAEMLLRIGQHTLPCRFATERLNDVAEGAQSSFLCVRN